MLSVSSLDLGKFTLQVLQPNSFSEIALCLPSPQIKSLFFWNTKSETYSLKTVQHKSNLLCCLSNYISPAANERMKSNNLILHFSLIGLLHLLQQYNRRTLLLPLYFHIFYMDHQCFQPTHWANVSLINTAESASDSKIQGHQLEIRSLLLSTSV